MEMCENCKEVERMCEEKYCADCFWDKDAEIKKTRRKNPVWVFRQAYSAAIVLFNVSHNEAMIMASLAVSNMKNG
jgi:hypothetical protein